MAKLKKLLHFPSFCAKPFRAVELYRFAVLMLSIIVLAYVLFLIVHQYLVVVKSFYFVESYIFRAEV